MRLTRFTDYGLRLLIHMAERPGDRCTVPEVAALHRISEHHLGKVAYALAQAGYVASMRGRGGGLRLACSPESTTIGEIVRCLEPCDAVAECAECNAAAECRLPRPLAGAMNAFLEHLDRVTLGEMCRPLASVA